METRSKRKAQDSSNKEPESSKRARSAPKEGQQARRGSREPSASAPKPREARTGRSGQQRGRPAAGAGQEITSQAAPGANAPAQGAMDRSGRRASRGEPSDGPPGGGDEDPDSVFGRNFAGASSALQGLLRKLGAGFEDIMSGGGHAGSRIKGIISGLRQFEDEGAQLSALSELSELLSISQEESLAATLPVEQVVPLLVQLLGVEHNPDVMLLAARCLTFLADVLPTSCGAIVRHGAVQAFCARLLTIEYIDLAEQSLQALDKISNEHPAPLLQQGGLAAVLSYLDFFPTGVQRVAVGTAAKMCAAAGPQHASQVRDAVPLLTNLLQYQDGRVVESACAALCCVADAFSADPSMLEALLASGAVAQASQLVAVGAGDAGGGGGGGGGGPAAQLGPATYFGLVRLLATCAAGSAAVAEALLQGPLADALARLLAAPSTLAGAGGGGVLRTADQLAEVVELVAALLPPVPDAATVLLQGLPSRPPCDGGRDTASGDAAARVAFLREHPEALEKYVGGLLPPLLQVYSSTVLPAVRHRCLAAIVKALYFSTPAQLEAALADLPISSFVASLLGGRDARAQAYALQMAELLMEQLPHIFTSYFVKEGVAHAVQQLAEQAASPASAAAAPLSPPPAGGGGAGGSGSGGGATPPSPPSPPATRSRRASQQQSGKDEPREPSQDTPREASRDRSLPPAAGAQRC